MGIGHRAQSKSILLQEKNIFSHLFPSYWEAFYFFKGDFHSTVLGGKKGALQLSEIKIWAPNPTSDTQWNREHFSQLLSADSTDVF